MVTYTFSPNTKAKSSEVNQNFLDCVSPFVALTNWTPGYTGFSSAPTTDYATYQRMGSLAFIVYRVLAGGTSNSTGFAITGLPIALASGPNELSFPMMRAQDNGTFVNNAIGVISPGSTTMNIYKDHLGNTWTASGSKYVTEFCIFYPVD